jgi:hypothetical protein
MSATARWQRRALRFAQRLRRLGAAGAAGLLLLAAAIAAVAWVPQLQRDTETLQGRFESESARRQQAPGERAPDTATLLARFREWFPPPSQDVADLRTVFRVARDNQVVLARGDYTVARQADARLATLDVVLPVRTTYGGARAFVAALLNELPHASLAELRMERVTAGELETRVHLTLYYRED